MIRSFTKWLSENLGSGEEYFTESLDMYGSLRNLEIFSPIGWEIEDATGTIVFGVQIEAKERGIKNIDFFLKRLEVEIENRVFTDKNDEGKIENLLFTFENSENVKIELQKLPFFLNSLEINFTQAENVDGEIDPKKVKIQIMIGNDEI